VKDKGKRLFYGYWIIAVGFVNMLFASGMGFYAFSVLNKPVSDDFGWSRGTVATAFTIFILTSACVSPVVGRFTDRRGPRQSLFLGTGTMALSLLLLSKTSGIWHYYLLHMGIGVGYVFMGVVPVSIVVSNWFQQRRGAMQGLAFTGIGFGGLALAPLIGNYLVPNLGWQNTYVVMALLVSIVMLPLIGLVIKDRPSIKGLRAYGENLAEPHIHNCNEHAGAFSLGTRQAVATSTFWTIAVTFLVYGMSMTAGLQNQVSILMEQGFSLSSAVGAIGIIGFFSGTGKFLFGYLCDRFNPKYAAGLSYTMTGFSLITMIHARSNAHLWVYAILNGLGQGGWAPILAMLVAGYFGLKDYGALLGFLQLVLMTGVAVGPTITGFAYDQTGSYRLTLWVIAMVCFVCVPFIIFMRKPKAAIIKRGP
jgi:MFS family permease